MSKEVFTLRLMPKLKEQLEDITVRLNESEPNRQYKYSQNSVVIAAIQEHLKKLDRNLRKKGY